MTWHVYVVRTVDGFLYTGIAVDVARRYREHRAQGPKTAKYLLAHPPRELVLAVPIGSRSLALKVEHHLRRLPRVRKESILRAGTFEFDPQTGRVCAIESRRSA